MNAIAKLKYRRDQLPEDVEYITQLFDNPEKLKNAAKISWQTAEKLLDPNFDFKTLAEPTVKKIRKLVKQCRESGL